MTPQFLAGGRRSRPGDTCVVPSQWCVSISAMSSNTSVQYSFLVHTESFPKAGEVTHPRGKPVGVDLRGETCDHGSTNRRPGTGKRTHAYQSASPRRDRCARAADGRTHRPHPAPDGCAARRHQQTRTGGRPSTPVEALLRMQLLTHLQDWSIQMAGDQMG
jgi:hypothetical protein